MYIFGEFKNDIELNAVQRANPEMQKRVYNAIRALSEADENPIISIHDHGAGGHLLANGAQSDVESEEVGDGEQEGCAQGDGKCLVAGAENIQR